MWGDYEVDLPQLDGGYRLFADGDTYFDDFSQKLDQLVVTQKEPEAKDGEEGEPPHFISALGVKHEWSAPREIGDITVGPYVNDMDIDTLESKM